jgi:microcystin-dependent protein
MGVVNTTYTFNATDVVTSAKLNNVIDETTFTSTAITGTTLALLSGSLKVNSLGIGANELANDSVTTVKILDGAVTAAKLAAGAALPAGAVMPFAMATAPTGWFSCDGTLLSRTTYALLFAAIGTTFGVGDGSTTFAIPDLRGRFVRSTGTDGTATSLALGVKQASANLAHPHGVNDPGHNHYVNDPGHSHFVNDTNTTTNGLANVNGLAGTDQGDIPTSGSLTNIYLSASATNISIQSSGEAESRPHNMALNYCIKY